MDGHNIHKFRKQQTSSLHSLVLNLTDKKAMCKLYHQNLASITRGGV